MNEWMSTTTPCWYSEYTGIYDSMYQWLNQTSAAAIYEDFQKEVEPLNAVKKNSNMNMDSVLRKTCYGVSDVRQYNNKVVKVFFKDGTSTKAVCAPGDTFSMEQGVTICLFKRLLSEMLGVKDKDKCNAFGTKTYNNIVRAALKAADDARAAEDAKAKAAQDAKQKHKDDAAAYKKYKYAKREQQIEIQKEAYLRAMREAGENQS